MELEWDTLRGNGRLEGDGGNSIGKSQRGKDNISARDLLVDNGYIKNVEEVAVDKSFRWLTC